ncbi:hypothetical protein PLEOSDRAFT_1060852 [Pleurotus ostreatus PC15]|uniref:Tuberous sclerosis 1 n=1 Tax=Pleurotus ostreatus (strain PC15) TaxID=1137138 RepID=A0A067PBC9_PLEO1|nr:hypothetical protein PLEOSDRAFT_1060852 [Pleurotus ostreatus PC15]
MPQSLLLRQLRAVLDKNESVSLTQLLTTVDDLVLATSADSENTNDSDLDDELQTIHDECADHSPYHLEVFLAVLFHLCPITPPISIISSWFDLVLRPALREPKLPKVAVKHAKELTIHALQQPDPDTSSDDGSRAGKKAMPSELRRRLMDLYLLDAFNEGSGGDILEWAELDQEQKESRACWKANLEDILLKYGAEHPQASDFLLQDLMTEVYMHFSAPSARLQLLMFLNLYTSEPPFQQSASILAPHPLMTSLLSCLLLDKSSTVCNIALTLIVKILPIFAVHANDELENMLPSLFAILARMMCWKERPPSTHLDDPDDDYSADAEVLEPSMEDSLQLRADHAWQRLELSFESTSSSPPSPRQFFTMLYYLFPCNVLLFLRKPVGHLTANNLVCPYTANWEDVLDENKIRSKSESLLRSHACHPSIVWQDAAAEMAEPNFWSQHDVAGIVSEASLLDLRNATVSLRARVDATASETVSTTHGSEASEEGISDDFHITRESERQTVISLEDMISTSVALRYDANVEILAPTSAWTRRLFHRTDTPREVRSSPPQQSLPEEQSSHVPEAISALQREVLLLRNELNLEQWLSRENAKHIGRLYHDRVLSKNAEAERQGLFNKLRKYRAQVVRLEAELKEHKAQASSAKNKYADWNTELQSKLRELREEKKSWITEAAALRTAENQAKTLFQAQESLLSDAKDQVFKLKTQITENQHKIDRLRDYEKQIEQHIRMQRLWEEDFQKFNDRGEQIELMRNGWKQMELRLESYQQAAIQSEGTIRIQQAEIDELRAQLDQPQPPTSRFNLGEEQLKQFTEEKQRLMSTNTKLRDDNSEMREEIEELRAMVELLKGQVSGKRGLISEPRASPVLYV